MVLVVVGLAVVVAVVAGVVLLVAGTATALGPRVAAGRALMPMGMLPLRVMALLRCQQHPPSLLRTSWPLLALGQPKL